MSKHTPAPWDYEREEDEFGDSRYWRIQGPTPQGLGTEFPYNVADTLNRHFCIDPQEDEANARLIAAAPELVISLRKLLDMVTDNRTHGPEVDEAVNALAKAEA